MGPRLPTSGDEVADYRLAYQAAANRAHDVARWLQGRGEHPDGLTEEDLVGASTETANGLHYGESEASSIKDSRHQSPLPEMPAEMSPDRDTRRDGRYYPTPPQQQGLSSPHLGAVELESNELAPARALSAPRRPPQLEPLRTSGSHGHPAGPERLRRSRAPSLTIVELLGYAPPVRSRDDRSNSTNTPYTLRDLRSTLGSTVCVSRSEVAALDLIRTVAEARDVLRRMDLTRLATSPGYQIPTSAVSPTTRALEPRSSIAEMMSPGTHFPEHSHDQRSRGPAAEFNEQRSAEESARRIRRDSIRGSASEDPRGT